MLENITKTISAFSVPTAAIFILMFGAAKKVSVYDAFAEGAKDGIKNTFSVIPPLVGLMVAIYALRASGAVELLANALSPFLKALNIPKEVLPLAILRPVSGSGSMAVVSDIFKNFGCDSYIGRCASVMMGSTETTFYTLAVYFGAVRIKNTRYAAKAALLADFFGMLAATAVARMFFK